MTKSNSQTTRDKSGHQVISDKFIFLGVLLNFFGTLGYIRDTLHGRTRPNRVSWSMWTLASSLAFAAEIYKGVGLLSLIAFGSAFMPFLVLMSSFVNKKSVWRLGPFDFTCGALSLLGIILWLVTKEGNVGISFAIAADGVAALPTIVKSYTHPETESYLAFGLAAVSAGIGLLTIKNWTFANYAWPAYILLICILISSLIKFKLGKKFPLKFAI